MYTYIYRYVVCMCRSIYICGYIHIHLVFYIINFARSLRALKIEQIASIIRTIRNQSFQRPPGSHVDAHLISYTAKGRVLRRDPSRPLSKPI